MCIDSWIIYDTLCPTVDGSITKKEYKMITKWRKKDGELGRKVAEADSIAVRQGKDIAELEKRVKQMECEHTSGWEYDDSIASYRSVGNDNYCSHMSKTCKHCGKVQWLPEEQWLQEQADESYEKHVGFIEQINELNEED